MERITITTTRTRRGPAGRDATIDPAVLTFWNRVEVILRRRGHSVAGQDADDVRQRVAAQFFADSTTIMARYTPERFANVALRSRADDHRRSERIQRGQGARLRVDATTGLISHGREVCALDAVDPDSDRLGTTDDLEFDVVTAAELRDALRLLDPTIARLLLLVAVDGWSVTDAAPMVGLSRAYANRRLSAAKAMLAEVITAA